MKKAILGFGVAFVLVLVGGILVYVGFAWRNSTQNNQTTNLQPSITVTPTSSRSSFELPIQKRSYKLGFAGYFPAHFQKSTTQEVLQFYKDIDAYAEIYGVHVDISDTNVLKVSAAQQSNKIVFVTQITAGKSWKQERQNLKNALEKDLTDYPAIEYLAIGNEINNQFDDNSTAFQEYFDTYKEIYQYLKPKFPNVKIFATFQYESLKGKAYLTGKKPTAEWSMLKKMDPYIDLVGITSYPYFDYETPSAMPNNYFSEIRNYSTKPLFITETAWITRSTFGNALDKTNYTGSQAEQSAYVKKLATILNSESVEAVNWFSFHDAQDSEKPATIPAFLLFDSDGLKTYDDTDKQAFAFWKEWLSIGK